MNYRRGFFRLWLVFTVLWIGYCGWLGVSSYRAAADSEASIQQFQTYLDQVRSGEHIQGSAKFYRDSIAERRQSLRDEKDDLQFAITYGPTIPIILLLLFPIFYYVERGFSLDRSSTPAHKVEDLCNVQSDPSGKISSSDKQRASSMVATVQAESIPRHQMSKRAFHIVCILGALGMMSLVFNWYYTMIFVILWGTVIGAYLLLKRIFRVKDD